MVDGNTDSSEGVFSGWIPNLNLQELVQLVETAPRPKPSISKDSEAERIPSIKGGPLLAGRELRIQLSPATSATASGEVKSSKVVTVTQIRVAAKPTHSNRGILLKFAIASLVVVGLVVFALVVMKSSDYSDVAVVKGERFENDHLAVDLGDALPDFYGLLLIDDLENFGDTLSGQDLVGKNTVLFVWGSWNEELVSWSQNLNYIRLVNFEGKNVQFLGLNLDKNRDEALSALNEDLAKWPHLFNADDRKVDEERPMFRLGVRSSPLILLIDSTGRLRAEGLEPGEVIEVYQELFE
jgi:hypothetical protein